MVSVCKEDDVPLGEGRSVAIDGRRVAVFRTATGWYALDNACPHAGGPLGDGILGDECVTCPLHNRRFRLETGEALAGGNDAVAAHQVIVRGGVVFVALASAGLELDLDVSETAAA